MSAERRTKTPPRLDLSGPEWKLWLAAALGVAYTVSWFAIEAPAPAAARPAASGPRVAEARPAPRRAPQAARVRTRSS